MEIKNHLFEGVPGGPGSSMLPLQEVWVQSLVGEIIHATGGAKKKKLKITFVIITTTIEVRCNYHPHFADGEIEAQGSSVTTPALMARRGLEPR